MGQVFYNSANELATVSTVFSVNGTPTDPTTVTLIVTDPDGQANTYTYAGGTVTKDSTGTYHKDVSCASTTPGLWTAVWVGTTAASDVDVVTWTTYDTDLYRLHVTPAELKDRTGIDDSLDDLQILGACMASTEGINLHCDRVFTRTAGTRIFEARCGNLLDRVDIVSITTLKTDEDGDGVFETTWSVSDYELKPVDALWKPGGPWPYEQVSAIAGRRFPIALGYGRSARVQIEGVFEFPRIPSSVKMSAAIVANDLLKLGGMSFGVQGYGEYGLVRARQNPITAAMLQPYVRDPVLVG